MRHKTILIKIINELPNKFEENEIAYLALTSKIEIPLRDKIAFRLHEKLNKDYLICREWGVKNNKDRDRIDLAIIRRKDETIRCLIEFKAHSVPRKEKLYEKYLLEDFKKMCKVVNNDSSLPQAAKDKVEMYYIFFNNCIESKIPDKFSHAVKYLKDINKCNKENTSTSGIKDNIKKYWEEYLKNNNLPLNKSEEIDIKAGNYYNIPVSIITFVYGPLFIKDLAKFS